MRIRTMYLLSMVFVVFMLGVPSAFAAGPPTAPAVLQSVTFEGINASDTLQVYDYLDFWNTGTPPTATWDTVASAGVGGSHGFWCAGSVPGNYHSYPVGTRGEAELYVPDASLDYQSQIQFSYIEPSLGTNDRRATQQPFIVNWASAPTVGATVYSDNQLPLTSSWTTIVRTRGALGNNPPLTAGWLRFQFVSDPTQAAGAAGPSIDDIKVTGLVYGPPVEVIAQRHHGSPSQATITWEKPRRVGSSTDPDPRDVWYRVWRHDTAAGVWTELTSTAISATTFDDSGLDAAKSYEYAVQGYTSPTDDTRWGVSAASGVIGPAQTHFGGASTSAASVPYGGLATISATLVDETNAPFAGEASNTELQSSFDDGATWATVATTVSEPTASTYSAIAASQVNTEYRLRHLPTNAVSPAVLVKSGTLLSVPNTTPSKPTHNKTFAVTGTVSGVPVATRSITLKAYHKETKTVKRKKTTVWVLRSTVVAKLPPMLGVGSYKVNMKLKLAGSYRLYAAVSDSYSTPISTGYRGFTVK